MQIKLILLTLMFLNSCWADGIKEANLGKITCNFHSIIINLNGNRLNTNGNLQLISNANSSKETITLRAIDLLPFNDAYGFKLREECTYDDAQRKLGSFASGYGFIVIPYTDGIQAKTNGKEFFSFLGQIQMCPEGCPNPGNKSYLSFFFNMVFTDPTLATAETHVYSVEFWDCLNGQCKLDEYDKKTVKRGEAIITVNYMP